MKARTCVAALMCAACADSGKTAADLIVTNAAVYTLTWPEQSRDSVRPDAEAVAARGGRIVFVGSTADALKMRGDSTEVIDAKGAVLLPGLVDAHVHLANLGAALRRVDLVGVTTEEEAVRRVEERAKSTPAGEWIVGYGWDEGAWANRYPDLRMLSARVANNPVWLVGLHTFAGWANQMALDRAKVDASTRAPAGGEIRRGAGGKPSGILLNNATRLVEGVIPRATDAEMDARMTAALAAVARAGYTAVHDANTDSEMLASLERLAKNNQIPVRVSLFLSARDTTLVNRWIVRGPDTSSASMLRVVGVKAFYDGALGSRGALLLAPYDDRPGERGRGGAEYGFDATLMNDALARGFQLMIHAIGDAGNRETLDYFEKAFVATPAARNGRHRVEHAQILSPADVPRFAKLGVIASVQPGHAVEDKAWAEQRVGAERIKGGYAWRSLRETGAQLLLSSDMPGSSYDFWYMLHAAITRRDPEGKPAGGWFPDERLTPEEAVRGFTTWGAYASHTERDAGTIAVGKWADLTLLDRDPFTIGAKEPEKLLGGKAVATIVAGRVVHDGR